MTCSACKDTGKVWDTTADAENGPSSDPYADMMFERPCDECEIGLALMHAENEANDKANREFFARLEAGDPIALQQAKEAWEGPDEEAAWERHTEFANR